MMPNGSVILITSVLVALVGFEMVENSLGHFYNIVYENRRSMPLLLKNSRNSLILNGTIYENGIAYDEINEINPKFSKIKIIEDAFKNIFAMNGINYIYKRNFYWRTWREVNDTEGNIILVCYRCQNIMNVTCTSCNCGYWEIEENPPCPFEILSVINSTNICVAYYNELKNSNANCPSIINFKDLINCDNPIESRWRISRLYNAINVSERHVNVICEERESCEFSTIYSIFPDHVTFRIINSSKNIIYSRIMKNDNKNYACVDNCGTFESVSLNQTKLQNWNTLKFSESKNNTENYFGSEETEADTKKDSPTKVNSDTIQSNGFPKISKNTLHFSKNVMIVSNISCKHLQNTHSEEDYKESEYNDY